MAPTATLMPFIYAQIAVASRHQLAGLRPVPDAVAWVGMAVITACGASAAWLNLRARPARHGAAGAGVAAD